LRSTRSSVSSSEGRGGGPSRAAIAILVICSVAIPAGVLAVILVRDDNDRAPSPAPIGSRAPDFTLPTTDGENLTLSAWRGRPVVVVFFASWCHPCEEELPVLEQLRRDGRGRPAVVAVSFRDLESDSVAFVRRLGVTFPALLDAPESPIAARYGVRGIPQTVFVDARGIVRGRIYGETSRRVLRPATTDLLAGRNIRTG
jgi:cytochrome c biogenesis protein CcmG/thiol:disulfide interchange protein DsbE